MCLGEISSIKNKETNSSEISSDNEDNSETTDGMVYCY